jgi:EAL domain-containing protein (putative c-di-GMP-specific phosphodiesterase class I)
MIQGYLISRPVPCAEVDGILVYYGKSAAMQIAL